MANKSLENAFFYNSQNGDRIYDADSFEYWLKKFFTTGVFEGDLQVKATSGMNVTVGSGYCNVDGKVKIWDVPTSFTLEVADELYDRIDSIVIQRNDTNREITIIKKTGTPSSNPVAPMLTRADGIYEIQLAQIRLSAGMISLTQSNITDTRTNKGLCGYVTGTVKNLDFSELNAQFNAYFSEFKNKNDNEFVKWFEKIKGQLSTDAAGKLQVQLDGKADRNELDPLKNQINKQGFVSSYQLTFSTSGGTSQTAVFYGNLTSDDYKVYLNYPSDMTLEQIQAIGECIPWITGVSYLSNTQVTVELKSGKAPKVAFKVEVVMEYVGKSA